MRGDCMHYEVLGEDFCQEVGRWTIWQCRCCGARFEPSEPLRTTLAIVLTAVAGTADALESVEGRRVRDLILKRHPELEKSE